MAGGYEVVMTWRSRCLGLEDGLAASQRVFGALSPSRMAADSLWFETGSTFGIRNEHGLGGPAALIKADKTPCSHGLAYSFSIIQRNESFL